MSEVKRGPGGGTIGIDGVERTFGQVLYEQRCADTSEYRKWRLLSVGDRDAWERLAESVQAAAERAVTASLARAAVTDEMVERAAGAIAHEFYVLDNTRSETARQPALPFPTAAYFKRIARAALEAALGDA
jgi:nicotinic acid phosphoribosyltransferase